MRPSSHDLCKAAIGAQRNGRSETHSSMQFARPAIAGNWFGVILASIVVLPLLAGCGGGGAKSETQVRTTTVSKGQALIDLKKALDEGAMTQSEYERARAEVLKEQ